MSDEIFPAAGLLLGRVKMPGFAFPRVVTLREGRVVDITGKDAPTVRDVCETAKRCLAKIAICRMPYM